MGHVMLTADSRSTDTIRRNTRASRWDSKAGGIKEASSLIGGRAFEIGLGHTGKLCIVSTESLLWIICSRHVAGKAVNTMHDYDRV